jgi:hypothetical protein
MLSVVEPITCQNRDHLEQYFSQLCISQPTEKRAEGVVLRDPTAWYYKRNTFFTKNALQPSVVMEISPGQYKWFVTTSTNNNVTISGPLA